MLKLRTTQNRELWENKSRWEAELSDGSTVYQNDDEVGMASWILLRQFLMENPSIHIKRVIFGFRDNYRILPELAEGYYFRNSVVGSLSGSKSSFIIGILKNGKCLVEKWEIPEMSLMWSEERDPAEAGESLIYNFIL